MLHAGAQYKNIHTHTKYSSLQKITTNQHRRCLSSSRLFLIHIFEMHIFKDVINWFNINCHQGNEMEKEIIQWTLAHQKAHGNET